MMLELNTIHLGDCQELIREISDGSIDLILQDPPYNTTACKWEWDIMTVIDKLWVQWKRIIKPNGAIVMTASQPFTSKLVMSNLGMFKYEWIWEKSKCGSAFTSKYRPQQKHENIIVFGLGKIIYNPQTTSGEAYYRKRKPNKDGSKPNRHKLGVISESETNNNGFRYPKTVQYFQQKWRRQDQLHPTQKPVALFEYLIRTYTNEGDTVFDGFSGSGTTAVACRNLKRNFICVEKDYDYWYLSMERLAQCE